MIPEDLSHTLDFCQQTLQSKVTLESRNHPAFPRRPAPSQDLFDLNSWTHISNAAHALKRSIDRCECAHVAQLVRNLMCAIVFPISRTEFDLTPVALEVQSCFEALAPKADSATDPVLRLFPLTVALLSIASEPALIRFLTNFLDGQYPAASAQIHANRDRVIRWYEAFDTLPSSTLRRGQEQLKKGFVKLKELLIPDVVMFKYCCHERSLLHEIESDELPDDWMMEPVGPEFPQQKPDVVLTSSAALGERVQKLGMVLNTNLGYCPRPEGDPKNQMELFDYGIIKRHFNSQGNGAEEVDDWFEHAKRTNEWLFTRGNWLCQRKRPSK
jgi:hypothetical protein